MWWMYVYYVSILVKWYSFKSVHNIDYCYWYVQKYHLMWQTCQEISTRAICLFFNYYYYFVLFLPFTYLFTQYVSTFMQCDNITLFYQPLTLCAIRYYTDKVKVCCVLFFLYAFFSFMDILILFLCVVYYLY